MSEGLLEILKPIVEPQMKKDIRIMIDTLRELGFQDSKIKMIIMEKYEMSEEKAGRQSCIGYFMIRKQEVIYLLSFFIISV